MITAAVKISQDKQCHMALWEAGIFAKEGAQWKYQFALDLFW